MAALVSPSDVAEVVSGFLLLEDGAPGISQRLDELTALLLARGSSSCAAATATSAKLIADLDGMAGNTRRLLQSQCDTAAKGLDALLEVCNTTGDQLDAYAQLCDLLISHPERQDMWDDGVVAAADACALPAGDAAPTCAFLTATLLPSAPEHLAACLRLRQGVDIFACSLVGSGARGYLPGDNETAFTHNAFTLSCLDDAGDPFDTLSVSDVCVQLSGGSLRAQRLVSPGVLEVAYSVPTALAVERESVYLTM